MIEKSPRVFGDFLGVCTPFAQTICIEKSVKMKPFMDKDFLLDTPTARHLYHDYCEALPICDYHCHLSPKEIYENAQPTDISALWLSGDHYKWRAMRSCGVDERYCTGDASPREKFQKFAYTLQYAIGNPLGVELRGTLTQGIISAIDRPVTMEGRVMTLLQTTAALNNGNSGGPLINEYGQVIGINTLKMSNTLSDISATVEGLGFAVPSSRVVSVINDIIATGGFRGLPSIGVYVKETEFADGTTHPVIDSVTENFGAEEAGLQKGDVILAADGIGVSTNTDLLAVRRTHIVGESVVLTIRRDGQTFDVTVVLYPVEG